MARITLYRLLSVPAFGMLYLFTAIMVLTGLPFIYLRMGKTVKAMIRFWAATVFVLIGKKIHTSGIENSAGSKRFILVANHASLFDIIAIVSVFPDIAWFGHERLLKIPLFRRVLLLTGYIPMRKATIRNTREMVRLLVERSADHNIAIFPEGTRTLDGKVNDFYRGFIMLLRSSEINVLPVTLNGFYSLKPKNRFYIDFGARLEMIIHQPIRRDMLVLKTDREITNIIKTTIESSINNYLYISPEEQKLKTDPVKI